MTFSAQNTQSQSMQDCIRACHECHDTCLQTLSYCLTQGGKHTEKKNLTTLMDCVQICHISHDFMLRGSDLHMHTCKACAEICEACARHCETMQGDETMQQCAETCRRCAEACRKMSQMA